MKRFLLGVLLSTSVLGVATMVHAQNNVINVSTTPGNPASYFQDFDGLSSEDGVPQPFATARANNPAIVPTIQGFYALPSVGALFTTYRPDGGSDLTPGIYSYGAASTAGGGIPSDRAFGSIAADTTQSIFYGFRFRNTGATSLSSIRITFDFEFWHTAQNQTTNQEINFAFSTTATSLTEAGEFTQNDDLKFSSGEFLPNSSSPDRPFPIVTERKTANITFATPVQTNGDIWIRWQDANDPNQNTNHGFAIDNVDVSFQPVPAPPAAISLAIGGLVGLMSTGVAKMRSRRRKPTAK